MAREKSTANAMTLGQYLTSLRTAIGLTLREVEEKTDKEVSNGYLSQLEHGRVQKPSPNILYRLAEVYDVPYERLMEKAGYIGRTGERTDKQKHGRIATSALDSLTNEEEEELLNYLAYLRSKRVPIAKNGR